MANPRKFSEKIALHNQKQLEETAAFEKIMREVSDATQKVKETFFFLLIGQIFFKRVEKCIHENLPKKKKRKNELNNFSS